MKKPLYMDAKYLLKLILTNNIFLHCGKADGSSGTAVWRSAKNTNRPVKSMTYGNSNSVAHTKGHTNEAFLLILGEMGRGFIIRPSAAQIIILPRTVRLVTAS